MSDFSEKYGRKLTEDYFDEYGNYKFPNQFEPDVPNTALPPNKLSINEKCKQFKDLMEHSIIYGFIHWEYELPNYIERAKKLKSGANILDYFIALQKTLNKAKQMHPNDENYEKYVVELNPNFYQILAESIHCLNNYEAIDKKEAK